MQEMQVYCIFSFGVTLPKKFAFITQSNSLTLAFEVFMFVNRLAMKFNA